MRYVSLTDEEIAALDGNCRPETQQEVDAALARLHARTEHPDLPSRLAGFVADVTAEARSRGRLVWVVRRIRRCSLCGRSAGYAPYKSGPRRGEPNLDRPRSFRGADLADRFVRVDGSASLGGCDECITQVEPHLIEALRDIEAEVPERLRHPEAPNRRAYSRRRCTVCGWEGHEGQMGRRPTVLGDGTYPGVCPECGAETGLFDKRIEFVGGLAVTEVDGR